MAKKGAIKVILRSTDPNSSYFYTTTKPSGNKEKLSFMKYDPVVRKHVEFKEEKMR